MASATATARGEAGRPRRRFSALTQRVLTVNLVAVGILVGGVIYLDQYQRGLIQGRLDALATQARIIAAVLGETAIPRDPAAPRRIDAYFARRLIPPLALPVGSRARLFGNDGELLVDSRRAARGGTRVAIRALPPPEAAGSLLRRLEAFLDRRAMGDLPRGVEGDHSRAEYFSEVVAALNGEIGAQARRMSDGRVGLAVAAPVRRFKEVLGALLLTADTRGIQAKVRETRRDALLLGLAVLAVTALLSLYLAGTVTRPIRRLAAAAEKVTAERRGPGEIPDMGRRGDEIGDLSVALRRMTGELRSRVDEIERFAADVAHELKNPLSSLQTAVDAFVRVEDPAARRRLRRVLTQDIARMDRLITDISAASRLDAELSRADFAPVDMAALLEAVVSIERGKAAAGGPEIVLRAAGGADARVRGIEERLAQVFLNLIDNAISFSPPGGTVRVGLEARGGEAAATVEDDGPGLPPGAEAAIFDRFYSERPRGEAFGLHSGLGLSIARRVVEAHGGRISAENRAGASGSPAGARFVVQLPRVRNPGS